MGRIDAQPRPIVCPGKKRGVELSVRYRAWETFLAVVGKHLPRSLRELLPATPDLEPTGVEVVTIGEPRPMDTWTPDIVRRRSEGVTWKEIVRRTGPDLNRAYRARKRYQDAQQFMSFSIVTITTREGPALPGLLAFWRE